MEEKRVLFSRTTHTLSKQKGKQGTAARLFHQNDCRVAVHLTSGWLPKKSTFFSPGFCIISSIKA
ncbi:hypothetical protein MUK42_36513 [Musa troglodytarum]|uniref:Uncharacterized protein n=1 Tax=Musa troglodytarum TaxID=320322 RepID=A0A9E7K025_9LILI|nr:hypothetical protein MUK42_36513 [Musa troglodytarum]